MLRQIFQKTMYAVFYPDRGELKKKKIYILKVSFFSTSLFVVRSTPGAFLSNRVSFEAHHLLHLFMKGTTHVGPFWSFLWVSDFPRGSPLAGHFTLL